MKKTFLLSCITLSTITQLMAQDSLLIDDGPYVFYENGKTVVRSIKDNQAEIFESPLQINVEFKDHSDWNFRVAIRSVIENEPTNFFPAADKLMVVSDIEGEFEAFRSLLIANNVIDKRYNWTFGKGHLVIDGDLFDRGTQVPEFLWLLYKLEQEAKEYGGYVHTLLGNHDIMNLSGDLRYLQPKYLQSAKILGMEYMQLYDRKTELGRWLRSKNVVERIDDNLFLHGGLSPEISKLRLSAEQINARCRPFYDCSKKALPDSNKVFFGKAAPFWYRGYFMAPKATLADVDQVLNAYQCSLIIVGHTILKRNIALYYGGKVLGVDVDQHAGKRCAALYVNGKWYRIDDKGKKERLIYNPENDEIKEEDIQ